MRSSKSRSRNKSNRQRSLGNIVNRVFDSSGPEGKVRGTPQQIIDKYLTLARDAQLSNDRVAEQSFLQHAEHYTRMLGEAQREMAERSGQQGFVRPQGEDEGEGYAPQGQNQNQQQNHYQQQPRRDDRGDRQDRGDRNDRQDRGERQDRDRQERGNRDGWQNRDRNDRQDRAERREERDDRWTPRPPREDAPAPQGLPDAVDATTDEGPVAPLAVPVVAEPEVSEAPTEAAPAPARAPRRPRAPRETVEGEEKPKAPRRRRADPAGEAPAVGDASA